MKYCFHDFCCDEWPAVDVRVGGDEEGVFFVVEADIDERPEEDRRPVISLQMTISEAKQVIANLRAGIAWHAKAIADASSNV